MLTVIITLAVVAVIFGLILAYSAVRFKVEGDPVVALLPQTQCGQCTYPGCRPYAEAMAKGEADINQCPPGGDATIIALADLLGVDVKPLNAEHGTVKTLPTVVRIDEQVCIGCTLCIQACPVDAILGAAKHMHTVIESECTGCDLCIRTGMDRRVARGWLRRAAHHLSEHRTHSHEAEHSTHRRTEPGQI